MLANAIERCILVSRQAGGTALLIDAKDEAATRCCSRYGAMPLHDRPLLLIISYTEFNKARIATGLAKL